MQFGSFGERAIIGVALLALAAIIYPAVKDEPLLIPPRCRWPSWLRWPQTRKARARSAADDAEADDYLDTMNSWRDEPQPVAVSDLITTTRPQHRAPRQPGDPAPPWEDAPEPVLTPEPVPEEPAREQRPLSTWKPGDPGRPPTIAMKVLREADESTGGYIADLPDYEEDR